MMRLHPDPLHPGVYVAYDDDGKLVGQGHLEVDEDGTVRFVNVLIIA